MSAVVFFIAAIGVIAGAVGVVMLKDPFYSVLSLVGHLICLAVLFLLLRSEFVAAIQVVVYAGAVMVLYVFVVAYVGEESDSLGERLSRSMRGGGVTRTVALIAGGALLAELLVALLGTGLKAIDSHGAAFTPGPKTFGTPAFIGELLLTRYLLVFEIASFLLLVAAVGAIVLAGRAQTGESNVLREARDGAVDDLSVERRRRPLGTGTMAEGVEGRPSPSDRADADAAGEQDGAANGKANAAGESSAAGEAPLERTEALR